MIRGLMMVAAFTLADPAGIFAQDDTVEQTLVAAKLQFNHAAEKARTLLLETLKRKEQSAMGSGNLALLQTVQAEIKDLDESGELPKSVPTRVFDGQMNRARARLEVAFADAVKEYKKAGRIELANTVQHELDEFKKGESQVASGVRRIIHQNVVVANKPANIDRKELDRALKVLSDEKQFANSGSGLLSPYGIKVIDGRVIAAKVYERVNVICTHPLSSDAPAVLDFTEATKRGRGTLLVLARSLGATKRGGGGVVAVRLDDKEYVTQLIDPGKWIEIAVPFENQSVVIEHFPIGWANEFMFFDFLIR